MIWVYMLNLESLMAVDFKLKLHILGGSQRGTPPSLEPPLRDEGWGIFFYGRGV